MASYPPSRTLRYYPGSCAKLPATRADRWWQPYDHKVFSTRDFAFVLNPSWWISCRFHRAAWYDGGYQIVPTIRVLILPGYYC